MTKSHPCDACILQRLSSGHWQRDVNTGRLRTYWKGSCEF